MTPISIQRVTLFMLYVLLYDMGIGAGPLFKSQEHFHYLGVRSILALSQLDLIKGDNAKLSCLEQPTPGYHCTIS
jgi:hypothetical protein